MQKRFVIVVVVLLLLLGVGTAVLAADAITTRPITIELRANESVQIRCLSADELIISPQGDFEALVTCRVWVGSTEEQ